MALRTGKVILAKGIKLDKNYKNIMDYSESQMVTLLQTKAVGTFNNCSFVRQGANAVLVEIPYGDALKANYIGFQNPDYSNKWFFGFIDEVEYVSDKTTRINYTIDECATWFDYWNPRACFVVREHTNDDTVGNNTLSEDVGLGEFVFNGSATNFAQADTADGYLCLGVTELISPLDSNPLNNWLTVYGGIYSGLQYMFFNSFVSLQRVIDFYVRNGKTEAIQTIFYVPYYFVSASDPKTQTYQLSSETNTAIVTWLEPTMDPIYISQTITRPSTLAGYTPKNNKLLTFPYCFFNITNNCGAECEYRYEDFSGNPVFDVTTTLCPSMSIKCTARNYKNGGTDETWGEGIPGPKTPQCSWVTDYYTNWLTQNAVNLGLSAATQLVQPFTAPNGTTFGLVGAITSIIGEHYKAQMIPDQVHGNLNSGDVSFSNNKSCFTVLPKSIKPEYARIIDDYFTMFGYKTSRLKIPNQTGRRYWNYVQIAEGESIGFTTDVISVPSASMDIINGAYQRGVTIWHNHDNIGDYTLSNTIV